jgi:hypothetical protein
MLYQLGRQMDANPAATVSWDSILALEVPRDLGPVIARICEFRSRDLTTEFSYALDKIDDAVAPALGLTAADCAYIKAEMKDDPFLSQLRPMLLQRGLRVQAYADHNEEDRYD